MLIGTTVLYVLSASDAEQINARRTDGDQIKHRLKQNPPTWPAGAQAHVGDKVAEGDTLPMLITRETPDGSMISGQVILNGSDTYWVAACELVDDDPPKPGQAAPLGSQPWHDAQRAVQTESPKLRGR